MSGSSRHARDTRSAVFCHVSAFRAFRPGGTAPLGRRSRLSVTSNYRKLDEHPRRGRPYQSRRTCEKDRFSVQIALARYVREARPERVGQHYSISVTDELGGDVLPVLEVA
jgi:hypothetical protein